MEDALAINEKSPKKSNGKIFVVGIGPGDEKEITPRALECLEKSDVIIGYTTYINSLSQKFREHKEIVSSSMRAERERCEEALRRARNGQNVALISGGDPGIYGMAGLMLEVVPKGHAAGTDVSVEIIPGVTAACAASAELGAPLSNDFAVISLSDYLTPWETIEKRLIAAAKGDFVICLYNPRSHGRPDALRRACEILLREKSPDTPAGWVRNAGREGQSSLVTTLARLRDEKLDMSCTAVVGNSVTRVLDFAASVACNGTEGAAQRTARLVTPRGYSRKENNDE